MGCYLHGGCPPGATRTYPGAREPADALDDRAFVVPGQVAFAWRSPTWGGGIAFLDAGAEGEALARAYLLTWRQMADVLEQEMWRAPGANLDAARLIDDGRLQLGPGRYETLHLVGELDGRPVVTFTAPDIDALGIRAPADAYLATMARGLLAAHGLTAGAVADYLAGCRGVGRTRDELLEALGRLTG